MNKKLDIFYYPFNKTAASFANKQATPDQYAYCLNYMKLDDTERRFAHNQVLGLVNCKKQQGFLKRSGKQNPSNDSGTGEKNPIISRSEIETRKKVDCNLVTSFTGHKDIKK